MGLAISLGLLLGGCGNGGGPGFAFEPAAVSDAKNAWLPGEQACVLTRSERPVVRVVNFSDPELCGRFVKARGPNYLRVPRPGEGSARN